MVHNPTCGCPSCFHINYPDRPNPHGTHNYKVSENVDYLGATSLLHVTPRDPYNWVRYKSITFYSECWWCGEPVYFHRNENGGCVLFDSLGPPWPIHACWEQYKHHLSVAIQGIIEKRISQLKSISIKNFQFIEKEITPETQLEGFILGFDAERRVLPDPAQISDTGSYLRYIVFRTMDGEHIKILAPEMYIEEIVMFSYSTIHIEYHKKSETASVCCARDIETNAIGSSERRTLKINYDYKRIMNMPWTHQSDLTRKFSGRKTHR